MDKQHRIVKFTATAWQQCLQISKFCFMNIHGMCCKLQKIVNAEKSLSPVISETAIMQGMTHFQVAPKNI